MDGKKVICFHGFGTSGEFMKFQMSSWVEKYPKTKFIHVDGVAPFAPFLTMDPDIIQFHSDRDSPVFDNFEGYNISDIFPKNTDWPWSKKLLPEIVRVVEIIKEHGGVEGILGFSQGALVSQLLIYSIETGLLDDILPKDFRPHFMIFSCPHPGLLMPYHLEIPVLILVGRFDKITPASFIMLMRFRYSSITEFDGGHRVPVLTSKLQRNIDEFVQKANGNIGKYRVGREYQKL